MSEKRQGPVLIEYDTPAPSPAEAEPVPDSGPEGRAMQAVIGLGARPSGWLGKLFWRSLVACLGFFISLSAWRALDALLAANPVLGMVGVALVAVFGVAAALVSLRELSAWARLGRLDRVQRQVGAAASLPQAQAAVAAVARLYKGRADLAWGLARLEERAGEQLDASTLLTLAETELMAPLDAAARREIEAAARQVATVTALVPLALADVVAALAANLRMIRRLGEIYGGRGGTFGALRLARTVLAHLVATGAVAVGDDLIETIAGGGLASKLSRRFGEGVVNGALTARVGVAALEVCRPMPFNALPKPRITGLVGTGLSGLFSRAKTEG